MAFDGITTKAIVDELQNIIGSKIDKIHEPDKNTIILGLYLNGKNYALNICIDSHNCRINLTTHQKENPLVAPNFCMLLRKHLLGGKISEITMQGLERVVKISIETINEFNEIEAKTLIIELMGKHSNVILTNQEEKIIDSMRHIDSRNSYREILPSRIYVFPKSDKLAFEKIKDFNEFNEKISNIEEQDLAKTISSTFTGISFSFAESAVKNRTKEQIYNYIKKLIQNSSNSKFMPIHKNDKISDYALQYVEQKLNNFELNFFIDDFYFERETRENFNNYKNNISRIVNETAKKCTKRLENMNSKLLECKDMDKYKIYGELITANLYRLSNEHFNSIQLENYYDNNNLITIPLDVKYAPNMNARRYFKKYSKLKNAFKIVSEQKLETEKEIDYIESIKYELESAITLDELKEISEEIKENAIFKEKIKKGKKNKNTKKSQKHKFSPIEYEIDGFKIYVGRNNKENDWLTLSFAQKTDIWFHTKDIHGSHVILKADKPISDDILVKAAEIAAKHSQAKESSNVPVDYCKVQYVKKPNSSKPGMVIFTNNKTLNVNPLKA